MYAQSLPPTPPLGSQDYVQFQTDLAIVKARWKASQEALAAALQQKQVIEANLADATQKYDDLLASVTGHSGDSTTYLQGLLAEIQTLKGQLKDSQSSVDVLRGNLESAKAEYDQKFQEAQSRAKALERENGWLKVGLVVLGAATLGLGVYAILK
jgi:chromosome segregation ATPase